MSPSRSHRRTGGCWTCKLRRKKCDELQPVCGNCDSLGIACNYGLKPPWMDGGEQQRQKTESIKDEIKKNAAHRREKASTSEVTHDTASTHHFKIISDIVVSNDEDRRHQVNVIPDNPVPSESAEISMPGDWTFTPDCTPGAPRHGSTPLSLLPYALLPQNTQQHDCPDGTNQPSGLERDFIIKYLDFIFPSLFPFYRPTLFETGRSWLLHLLGKSKIAYHSTVSLSCYLFTMALTDVDSGGDEEHTECKALRWEEIEQHTNKCFESIRMEMLALDLLSTNNTPATKLEKVTIMESVVQVLIFEIALGRAAPWNSHLPPAYALFEKIMASFPGQPSYQDQGQSNFASILLGIGPPLWTRPGYGNRIWSPEQTGFRFCAGLLIFIDVVASTALQQTPRLLPYHKDVFAPTDDGTSIVSEAEVRLSGIVGCRNWVIRSIAQTSALNSWKREQINANSLSVMELVNRASVLASELSDNIRPPLNIFSDPSTSSVPTLIWAHAAQLYLVVTVSGWQLSNTEIRANVAQIIKLLQTVLAHQLRALAWPICVAGCLALKSEEAAFVALFSNQAKVYTAGALNDVRQILDQVWQRRPTTHTGNWDFASCFSILGAPILLV
ncbi:hypothetical protein CC80DRAFT_474812 [Byssothecium circinans]|uniref:Zn(2)-C6 fungal-type domain-containing protein n=1 Tax=Byssothecium circinans TaxID=147558 RepID=A0A6A5TSI8_9PLEO|nr:hypothetical protein CC80DRAFT_474812 [Byssothecium circinans]